MTDKETIRIEGDFYHNPADPAPGVRIVRIAECLYQVISPASLEGGPYVICGYIIRQSPVDLKRGPGCFMFQPLGSNGPLSANDLVVIYNFMIELNQKLG